MWSALVALQKQMMAKKLNLKLTLSDVFYTSKMDQLTRSTIYNEHYTSRADSRLLTMGISYRFGNSNAVPKKTTQVDEAKQRAS